MREFANPAVVESGLADSLTSAAFARALQEPTRTVFSQRQSDGGWRAYTAGEFAGHVEDAARGLIGVELASGERIALLGPPSYAWTVADYAAWHIGAVTVPLYESASATQIGAILRQSGAKHLLVDPGRRSVLSELRENDPELVGDLQVFALDLKSLEQLAAEHGVSSIALKARHDQVRPTDLATLVYTSGTTGDPHGCELTHEALLISARTSLHEFAELLDADARTLVLLPLAHIFARQLQVTCVEAGVHLGYASGVSQLRRDLREFSPTFIFGVPRVFEKLYTLASQHAAVEGRAALFNRATRAAIAYSRSKDVERVSPATKASLAFFHRMIYADFLNSLGGQCRFALAGGAPLGDRLGHFFRGIGVPILEGYGLTETTSAITANTPTAHKVGTVGRPLPGVHLRISDDGELLANSPCLMRGYHRDPEGTAQVLRDGWLHTGDVGEIDAEGFVRITGRMREILITTGGKNVSPALLEEQIRLNRLISNCIVVGDGRPFVSALVTLDLDEFDEWKQRHSLKGSVAELADHPELRRQVQLYIDRANAGVSPAEAIRRFLILERDFSEADGHVTASLKLRRRAITHDFRTHIESLYLP